MSNYRLSKIEFLVNVLQLKLELMSAHFLDGNMFMTLPDGSLVYNTKQRTWQEVFMHKLPVDDCLYYQSHRPNISFHFKNIASRPIKKKEGLNDEDRCDYCKETFDSITFRSKKDGSKYALCSVCDKMINRMRDSSSELRVCYEHLSNVDSLLYRTSLQPGVVSVSWIFPYLSNFIDRWKRSKVSIATLSTVKLQWVLDSWYDEYGYVNISSGLINELQTLQGILSDEVDTLICLERKKNIWW